jgi:hypothetical protein
MKFIGQAIQVLELFHYHGQLLRAGIKHAIQHALQTSAAVRGERSSCAIATCEARKLFFIAGQLPVMVLKSRKADHFSRRILMSSA